MTSPLLGDLLQNPDVYASRSIYGTWSTMRRDRGLVWSAEAEGPGFWSACRYDDVLAVLRSPDLSCASGVALTEHREILAQAPTMLVHSDPPYHSRVRAGLNHRFSPRNLVAIESELRRFVRERFEEVGDASFDAVSVVGEIAVYGLVLGIGCERADRALLVRATRDFTDADADIRAMAYREVLIHSAELARDAYRGGPSVVADLRNINVDGCPLADHAIAANVFNLLAAGADTTRLAGAALVELVAECSTHLGSIRRSPTCVSTLVEELLRFATPIPHVLRTALRPLNIADTDVRAGEQIVGWIGSANRDPARFATPNQFVPTRSPNRHLALGSGIHTCLGASLVRLELRVLAEELARFAQAVVVIEPATVVRSILTVGPSELRVVLSRR
jgi:cytochrome P450